MLRIWIQIVAMIFMPGAFGPLAAAEMSPEQRRGERIYLYGVNSDGGEIRALLNTGRVDISASLMPCVNCHGHDGRGIAEGGYVPSDLRWEILSRPYNVTQPSGRRHKSYTEQALKTAIAMGRDPSGNPLNPIMPNYRLNHRDMSDLVAYLKGLGNYSSIGLGDSSINIGVILPRSTEKATATTRIIEAYLTDFNTKGGVFRRTINLFFFANPAPQYGRLGEFESQLDSAGLFALVASELDGLQDWIRPFCKARRLPVVGAFSQFPPPDYLFDRYIFYLFADYKIQALAMGIFARQQHPVDPSKIRIMSDAKPLFMQVAEQLAASWGGGPRPEIVGLDGRSRVFDELLDHLHEKRVEQLFFLGNIQFQQDFIDAANRRNWQPQLYFPSVHMNQELLNAPQAFDRRIFLALPALPDDNQAKALTDYQDLASRYDLSRTHLHAQLRAVAAAKVLIEALTRAGRALDPEKLVKALESLYEFDTGLSKAVTFGPNRRVGTSGAYIVAVDLLNKTIVPVSKWVDAQ